MHTKEQTIDGIRTVPGQNAHIGPRTIERITRLHQMFDARLAGTPTPQDGDAVTLHGRNRKGPVTYDRAHLETSSFNAGRMSYCTQPMEPHIWVSDDPGDAGACQASGGYWGHVAPADLKHIGTVEKWFWIWGEDGAGKDGGVHVCFTVNRWEHTDEERIY